jgi:vitamin B12 transporter
MTSRAATETGNAQVETDDQITEITVEAPRPDWESELSPGTVTVIRPDDYQGEQKTLPELLKDVPGVHVRYVSGKGGYTTVSVRGSTAAQVGVFADGVLVNLGGDAAMDLSTIPVKNIERIEVYRGYIPARFGGAYMGGAINIVTKKPQQSEISSAAVGAASYGGFKANVEINAPLGGGSLLVGFNHEQSNGDFPYTNPGVKEAYANALATYETQTANIIADAKRVLIEENPFYSGSAFISIDDIFAAESEIKQNIYQSYINNGKDAATATEKAESIWRNNFYNPYLTNEASLKDPVLQSSVRHRQNNDYQNSDALIKWQDGHWTVKGTYKHIDRGLPQNLPLPGNLNREAYPYSTYDLPGSTQRKRQEITGADLLVGRRAANANLEWGWNLNYLNQDKRYRNLDYQGTGIERPLDEWSKFDSRRWGGALVAQPTWNDVANPHAVATKGRWMYATGYDLARIAVANMNLSYVEVASYQFPTAWSISVPPGTECHGEGLTVVGDYLYALFTINPGGEYTVYANSIVVKLEIDTLDGSLTYISHLEVGKNAFTLEPFNNKLYVCALGGRAAAFKAAAVKSFASHAVLAQQARQAAAEKKKE